ncbi:hypothetical protein ACVWY0_003176 [Arthrobacter sp. UYNi723]
MTIDVARHESKPQPPAASKRLTWKHLTALAGFGFVTCIFVITQTVGSGMGREFWAVMAVLGVNWLVFGATFWLSRSKPRRRKESSPKLTA